MGIQWQTNKQKKGRALMEATILVDITENKQTLDRLWL